MASTKGGGGRRGGNPRSLLNDPDDVLIHARTHEAAARAAEADGVETRVAEQIGQLRHHLYHVQEGFFLIIRVGDAGEVNRYARRRHALAFVFHHRVPGWNDEADLLLPVRHGKSSGAGSRNSCDGAMIKKAGVQVQSAETAGPANARDPAAPPWGVCAEKEKGGPREPPFPDSFQPVSRDGEPRRAGSGRRIPPPRSSAP